jgi:two-component system sensor histidine kinase DevS
MLKTRSPGSMVVWAAYGCAALVVLIVVAALRMPTVGVSFVPDGKTVAAVAGGKTLARLRPADDVVLSSPTGELKEAAGELVQDFAPNGSSKQIELWYAQRSRLAAISRAGLLTLTVPAGSGLQTFDLHPAPRSLGDLSADVWMLLGQGCLIGLLGVWIAVLRPSDLGGRLFAVSCLGVLVAAFSGALFDARELTADGRLLQLTQGLNFVGSDVCAAGLVGLFLIQPIPLVRPWAPVVLIGLAVLGGLFNGLGWLSLTSFYLGLVILSAMFLCVLVLQWVRSRRNPAARAVLRWVGVTTFVGTGGLTVAMAAPELVGLPSVGGDGLSFIPLFIVYGGIAFGVGGHRLFDLDRWSYRLIMGAAGALALLAADAALIGGLGLAGPAAFAISILVVGYLYFPARLLLWRWIAGRPALSESELFQSATEVAFAADVVERRHKWRILLSRLFDPLDIVAVDDAPDRPSQRADGVELTLPATVGDSGLVLRYRSQGRRLFDSSQVRLAHELVELMHKAEKTRDEYTRGVVEERQRIARDLHDDVSARLLTSLHRDEVSQVRSDVRKAMADIRTIVSSLTGETFALDQVMADLRYETTERLKTAKIELTWPLPSVPFEARPLDYSTYKGLISSHREIVSNILQHAGAGRVVVSVRATGEVLYMTVEDDGQGMQAGPRPSRGGNGLRNINHRLDQIRGSFIMAPGTRGMRVEVTIPLVQGV